MVIRHLDSKYGDCFFYGDEVFVKKISEIDNFFEDGASEDDKIFVLSFQIKDITNWYFDTAVEFYINKKLDDIVESKNPLAIILLKRNNGEIRLLAFTESTYLMSDDGKTIQKII